MATIRVKVASILVQSERGNQNFVLTMTSVGGKKIVQQCPVSVLEPLVGALVGLQSKLLKGASRKLRKPTVH